MTNPLRLLALLALAAFVQPASAGSVVLADGTTRSGTVLLVGTGGPAEARISVLSPGKAARVLKLSDIKSAVLDVRAGDVGSRECDGVPWSRTEIGNTRKAGAADINGRKITIKDSSDGFRIGRSRKAEETPATDSCCFVFQKLEGDGEISAKVLPSDITKWTRGGLLICEGLDGTGPMAMVTRTADPVAATLLTRLKSGAGIATTADAKNVNVPSTFLKISRTGQIIKAFESLDGVKWTEISEQKILFDDTKGVYIGVAATGNSREGTVLFENIRLSGKRSVPELAGIGDSRLPDVSLALHDGTVIAGNLESITAGDGKLKRSPTETMTIPVAAMDRAQFFPLTRAQTEKFLASTTGMLTRDGDFLDGDIKEVKPDSVTVSSVTFGLTTMDRSRVFGLVFPAATENKPQAGLFDIRLQDGSLIKGRKLTLDKEQVIIDEPLLGEFRTAAKDIVSIDKHGG